MSIESNLSDVKRCIKGGFLKKSLFKRILRKVKHKTLNLSVVLSVAAISNPKEFSGLKNDLDVSKNVLLSACEEVENLFEKAIKVTEELIAKGDYEESKRILESLKNSAIKLEDDTLFKTIARLEEDMVLASDIMFVAPSTIKKMNDSVLKNYVELLRDMIVFRNNNHDRHDLLTKLLQFHLYSHLKVLGQDFKSSFISMPPITGKVKVDNSVAIANFDVGSEKINVVYNLK